MKLFSKLVLVAGLLSSMSSQAFSHGLRDSVLQVRNAAFEMVEHGLVKSGYVTRHCPVSGTTTVVETCSLTGQSRWYEMSYSSNLDAWTSSTVWIDDVVYLNALDASSRLYYASRDLLILMDDGVFVGDVYDQAYDYFYASYYHFVDYVPTCHDLVYSWPGYTIVTTTWYETFTH